MRHASSHGVTLQLRDCAETLAYGEKSVLCSCARVTSANLGQQGSGVSLLQRHWQSDNSNDDSMPLAAQWTCGRRLVVWPVLQT
jgi:hypothetical protein